MRIIWSLTILTMIVLPLWGADAVDFDKLFRAASGQLLPEPPSEEKERTIQTEKEALPAPKTTHTAPQFGPLNSNSREDSIPVNGTKNGVSSPTLQSPREYHSPADAPAMPSTPSLSMDRFPNSSTMTIPELRKEGPLRVGSDCSMDSSVLGSPISAEPAPADRIDFNTVFQEMQSSPKSEGVYPPVRTAQVPSGPAPCHAQICTVGCEPRKPAVGCLYDGPILGVPRGTIDDSFRCPNCYRDIWAGYAQEKAREEERFQKSLRGNDCSNCKPQYIGCPTL